MSAKKAKLNLDFGHGGISMNYAKANEIQPRNSTESDWEVGTFKFNTEEFEDFPGISQNRVDDASIKTIAGIINNAINEWQRETGCDFDPLMEITVSATFFDVLSFPYSLEFSRIKDISENDMKEIEECKRPSKMSQIPIPDEKMKSLTSPYFTVLNEKNSVSRYINPIGRKTKSLGFNAYFITKHPVLSRLLEIMKEDGDRINVSLSCEKEFDALANKKERIGKTLLIHITNFMSEFSIWDNSELKYLNKKEGGFKELREAIWRLCLFYNKNVNFMRQDFELTQRPEHMQRFYDMAMKAAISNDSKDLLSADDCSVLLGHASCILENETEESVKYRRHNLPDGKNGSKSLLTLSDYILCYFARETLRKLLVEIKKTIYEDDFCKPESIIVECPLPLKGVEKLVGEVFGISARRAVVKWDDDIRNDLSSSGVGALKSLIANNTTSKKDTARLPGFLEKFLFKAS